MVKTRRPWGVVVSMSCVRILKPDPVAVELPQPLERVERGAREPVELPDHDQVDAPVAGRPRGAPATGGRCGLVCGRRARSSEAPAGAAEYGDDVQAHRIYRICVVAAFLFSLSALGTILTGVAPILLTGHVPPPVRDEGTQAHIFQLSIAALLPVGMVCVATADWTRPQRVIRALTIPAAAVLAAFALLYYFEHVIY